MNKNEFYYKILNIGKGYKDINEMLDIIIKKELNSLKKENNDMVGLCKVAATNISVELDKEKIDYRVVDLEDYNLYDHTFIIARSMIEGKINYYLIDLTFIQFKGYYPYNNLEKKSLNLLNNLLEKGYSRIDNKDYNLYFNSFEYDGKLDLNDVFLKYKRKSKLSR